MSIYDTLNQKQQEACFHTEGPVLILAGAGSGKTRVITHRIAYLLEECDVNPWNILAITFTNKAAGEMRERVDKLIGFGAQSVWISTFHSMCVRILRRHIEAIGYDRNFTIYDTDDQKALIRQILVRLSIDPKVLRERAVMSAVSSAKNKMETPEIYREHHAHSETNRQIADVYDQYERELRKNNALDFDDLLLKTAELFRTNKEILESYQNRFRYIMVDEYQDTNQVQFNIVSMLAGGYRNLCVVGDDDQSIYKFRGADIRNILNFETEYPDALVVKLEQNYRSTQNILDAANAVISNNTHRKDKKLWTEEGAGSLIHFRSFGSAPDEASFIAEDIDRKMRQDHSLSYKDFAVLYRTNAQSRLIEDQFVRQSIPYNIVGGHNFYDRMEVRDILSYLRTIANPRDDISCQRIINIPKRGIGKTTIDRVLAYAQARGTGFFEALENMDEIPDIARAKAKLSPFVILMKSLRDFAESSSVSGLIEEVIKETGYENYLRDYDSESADDRLDNVSELISKAVSYEQDMYEQGEEAPTLQGFLEDVSLVADIDQVGGDDDRVLLMTLHSAKGLEFSNVYLAGMEEGLFPSYQSAGSEDEDALEEERRLAYVGITRARKDLTITHAQCRMIRGDYIYNPVSRFVLEIPEKLLDESPRLPGRQDDSFEDDDLADMPWNESGESEAPSKALDFPKKTQQSSGYKRSSGGYSNPYLSRGFRVPDAPKRKSVNRPKAAPQTKEFKNYAKTGLDALKGMPLFEKPAYSVGDRVRHVKFGDGTVENIERTPKDFKVVVKFDGCGQKIMYAAFAKLVKI